MEKLDKKNILYIGGAIASVAGLAWLWASHSASSAAKSQAAADQANSGMDPATAAYEAAIGAGGLGSSAPTSYGNSTPVSSGFSSGTDLASALPALVQALGLGPTAPVPPVVAPTTDYSAQITQLYQADLGRAPETAGTTYYNSLLNSGTSLSTVSSYIAASPEAQSYSANQKTSANTNLISQDFQTLLGRAPDASGLAFYQNYLDKGGAASNITSFIQNSPEYLSLHSNNTVTTAQHTEQVATPAAANPGAAPTPSPLRASGGVAYLPKSPK